MDTFIGLAVGAQITPMIPKPTWEAAVSVFLVCFARSSLMWFRDHPIPEKIPDTTSVETVITTKTESNIKYETPSPPQR